MASYGSIGRLAKSNATYKVTEDFRFLNLESSRYQAFLSTHQAIEFNQFIRNELLTPIGSIQQFECLSISSADKSEPEGGWGGKKFSRNKQVDRISNSPTKS